MGGEKCPTLRPAYTRLGSPPRGRGKGNFSPPFDNPKRITPAWAGKRRRVLVKLAASRDHPRVGGEKHIKEAGAPWRWGSPPRGRGKERQFGGLKKPLGITPAWAGKRASSRLLHITLRDHPRVGGEKKRTCP